MVSKYSFRLLPRYHYNPQIVVQINVVNITLQRNYFYKYSFPKCILEIRYW